MFGKFKMISIGELYERTYNFICGTSPKCSLWHFQWHFMKDTHTWQKSKMSLFEGDILDVGCGNKPYQFWVDPHKVDHYLGLDVVACEGVDIVVTSNEMWGVVDNRFDGVLMTQSLEHLEHVEHTLKEVKRVLKPSGYLLITVPFLYPEHGAPYDFRRFTTFGLKNLLEQDYEILDLTKCGRFGSVFATMLLTFIENNMNVNFITRLLKGVLFPIWILFGFSINIFCEVLNWLDISNAHYCNVCLFARKKSN